MPSIKDDLTVEAIAKEYCSNGRNKGGALRTVGYAESSCISGKALEDVYGHLRVRKAIEEIDAKTVAEMDLSRKAQYQRLLDIHDETNTGSVKVACLREINEMLGYHRDKAPNAEKLAEIQAGMDAEELAFRTDWARRRADELSKGPKLAGKAG